MFNFSQFLAKLYTSTIVLHTYIAIYIYMGDKNSYLCPCYILQLYTFTHLHGYVCVCVNEDKYYLYTSLPLNAAN